MGICASVLFLGNSMYPTLIQLNPLNRISENGNVNLE